MRKKRHVENEKPIENKPESEYVKTPPVWDSEHLKSFRDQAIEVLNYLDSIGEGIYEPGRHGGMYLHQFGDSTLPTSVKTQFNNIKMRKEENKPVVDEDREILKKLFHK